MDIWVVVEIGILSRYISICVCGAVEQLAHFLRPNFLLNWQLRDGDNWPQLLVFPGTSVRLIRYPHLPNYYRLWVRSLSFALIKDRLQSGNHGQVPQACTIFEISILIKIYRLYFWLSISLSNSNVWIKSRIFESINKTDLMSHYVSQFMSQFWIRSFTRRSLIFGKLSFRIFRLQSREMEFQMNWIPINSCDFFIWHSISRDSESVQFERHSNNL